jgi:HEAT repeat protein
LQDRRATPVLLAALGEELTPLPEVKTESDLFQRVASEKELVPVIAARALGELGDPAAVPGLLAQVGHPEAEMRVAVFEALARMGSSEALPAARMALAEDTEQRVRRWAGVLLKTLKEPETLPDLRRALEEDPDPGVRLQVVQALEVMNDRESVARIRSALVKEKLKEVRAAMEHALVRLSPPPVSTTTN